MTRYIGPGAIEGCARSNEDAFNMLCGDLLGRGLHRAVFRCKLRDGWVVKVEAGSNRRFANVLESELWEMHQYHEETACWLAPCGELSPDGRLLLQRRTDPLPLGFKFPPKMPAFLTDLKRSNFGLWKGNLVCHDYALSIPNPDLTPRRAKWRKDE